MYTFKIVLASTTTPDYRVAFSKSQNEDFVFEEYLRIAKAENRDKLKIVFLHDETASIYDFKENIWHEVYGDEFVECDLKFDYESFVM